jgi:hypothetical protein
MSAMPTLQHVFANNVKDKSCTMSCCKKVKQETKTNQNCKGTCTNPFMSCCGFCTLTSNEKFIFFDTFFTTQKFKSYADKVLISFYASAWHPPQMV